MSYMDQVFLVSHRKQQQGTTANEQDINYRVCRLSLLRFYGKGQQEAWGHQQDITYCVYLPL